jgi:hypothetical protein
VERDRRAHQMVSMQVDRQVSPQAPFTEQLVDMTRFDDGEEGRAALLTRFKRSPESLTGHHVPSGEPGPPRFPMTEPPVFPPAP